MSNLISTNIPDPEVLIAMRPDELAGLLIEHINALDAHEQSNLHRENKCKQIARWYPTQHQDAVLTALRVAWHWLDRKGLLIPKGDPGWFDISEEGRRIKTAADLQTYLDRMTPPPQLADNSAVPIDLGESKSSVGLAKIDSLQTIRIVVASPNDVKAERDVLPKVIDELNRGIAGDRGIQLVLSRWETDAHPGFHSDGPQGLIDPILKIIDCDLLIGIFWQRFGTPTADGQTGTEHEFRLAYQAWQQQGAPQIFVYFNDKVPRSLDAINLEQLAKVRQFKSDFPPEGLWWSYKGKPQFENLVRNHLTNYIRNPASAPPKTYVKANASPPALNIAQSQRFGRETVRGWFQNVIAPLLQSLRGEEYLLAQQKVWTWRWQLREFADIHPAGNLVHPLAKDSLEHFVEHYPEMQAKMGFYDQQRAELVAACQRLQKALMSSKELRSLYERIKADDSEISGRTISSEFRMDTETENLESLAESIVNRRHKDSLEYTFRHAWNKYYDDFLALRLLPDINPESERVGRAGEGLLEAIQHLVEFLKGTRKHLAAEYDVPF